MKGAKQAEQNYIDKQKSATRYGSLLPPAFNAHYLAAIPSEQIISIPACENGSDYDTLVHSRLAKLLA